MNKSGGGSHEVMGGLRCPPPWRQGGETEQGKTSGVRARPRVWQRRSPGWGGCSFMSFQRHCSLIEDVRGVDNLPCSWAHTCRHGAARESKKRVGMGSTAAEAAMLQARLYASRAQSMPPKPPAVGVPWCPCGSVQGGPPVQGSTPPARRR